MIQKDFAWHDQTGAPTDPQAGNIPGGPRDVLRTANFNGNQFDGFYVDSGSFAVTGGALSVAASSLGQDAAAVFQIGDALPSYYEVQASISTDKPLAGWKANAYIIFDYASRTDFKFAGIDVAINKLVMGHRDASGWIVDAQTPFRGKPDVYYNLLLSVNGLTATLIVDNQSVFSMAYAPRVVDGWSYGLNWGLVGFGSDNSRGLFDNITVQVLPPQVTYQNTDDFSGGSTGLMTGGSSGTWISSGGSLSATPAAGSAAYDLVALPQVTNLQTSSWLELTADVTTGARAGLVFDWYSPTDYKWVALDTAGTLSVGHTTARSGRVTDKSVSGTILAGSTHTLGVSLKGMTVSVTLDGQSLLGYVFNSVVVDGRFGLTASGGAATFDNVKVKTNDSAFATTASALLADASQQVATQQQAALTAGGLAPVVAAAKQRWAASGLLDAAQLARLDRAQVSVGSLLGGAVGLTTGIRVVVDALAGGRGWFVDSTPLSDEEFRIVNGELAAIRPAARAGVDLLTVVVHELGHVVGYEHSDAGVMEPALGAGVRRLPGRAPAAGLSPLLSPVAPSLRAGIAAAAGAATIHGGSPGGWIAAPPASWLSAAAGVHPAPSWLRALRGLHLVAALKGPSLHA